MKKTFFSTAVAGGVALVATCQPAFAASGQDIVSEALQYQGTPYAYGASTGSTASFDCSSFTKYIFKTVYGVTLPRTSAQQATQGTAVSRNALQVGDLLFFDTVGDGGIHHVGIYTGNGQMISSELTYGVHLTNVFSGGGAQSYWQSKFVKAVRITAASAAGASAVPASAGSPSSYTVQSGDSLWQIANTFNMTVDAIKAANNLSSSVIYPGQTLMLGAQQASAVTSAPAATPSASASSTYTVQSGDSLWQIAKAYGVSVAALKSANHLTSDVIYVGQTLQVSATAAAQTGQSAQENAGGGYTVASGDCLWNIATLHGTSVNQLMRANNLSSTLIYPGQQLVLP
ncbi:MAG: LysM peptidoglycan-binding domain-containing protein [Sporolactobacillus sp.]